MTLSCETSSTLAIRLIKSFIKEAIEEFWESGMTIEFFYTIPRHVVVGLISASFLVCGNPLIAVERTDPSAQIMK